jgi:hypothetical protein
MKIGFVSMPLAGHVRNMRRKDRSMSRYPEFAAYKDRTGIFLPSLRIGSRGHGPLSRFLQLAFEHGIDAREAQWNSNAHQRP